MKLSVKKVQVLDESSKCRVISYPLTKQPAKAGMPKIVRFCLLLNSAHISGTVRVHAAVRFNRYRTRESVSLPWSGSPYFAALDWPSVRHWMRAVNLSRHH